jgi:hypothetical protein
MQTSALSPSVYQLRVVVQGMSPLIWRRLLVRSDMSLAALHDVLQIILELVASFRHRRTPAH